MKLYKFLNEEGLSTFQDFGWSLPKGKRPGKWMPKIKGELVECARGYHLCRPKDLMEWLAPSLYEVEFFGEMLEAESKVVVREARLVRRVDEWERIARLFGTDCSAKVLPIFEERVPGDYRPRIAISVARMFVEGRATPDERSAAYSAAYSAAHSVADSAAYSSAYSSAYSAARSWQTTRLLKYLGNPNLKPLRLPAKPKGN